MAVQDGAVRVSYGELADRTRRLELELRALGARPGARVAIVMAGGWQQVVAAVAVARSGAAYVPIDAANPPSRVAELVERVEPCAILVREGGAEPPPGGAPVVTVSDDPPERHVPAMPGGEPQPTPGDLAYVIFTSGSTGAPKGVMIDHVAAQNTIADVNERFGVGPEDRVFALSSLAFDLSVYDVFGTLAAGGTIVVPGGQRGMPRTWRERLFDPGVTIWNSVPQLMGLLVDHLDERGLSLPESLRLVMLSGDWIPLSLPGRIRALAPNARVVSLGGATEASIWSILHPVDAVDPDWPSVPYGRAMRGQTVEVLDPELEPAAPGESGEICIGGAGLARGYWRDEEATRRAFVTHPRDGRRLYRTGDAGRVLPDGTIELLGRLDHQVKIQGNRIELGEVERTIERHPHVHAAAATAEGERDGPRRLVGYYCRVGGRELDRGELRAFLAERLPAYMVPSALVELDELPLSANGKVDRSALRPPAGEAGTLHAGRA